MTKHIMVDIETLGTRPDKHHLIQLAAVAFDLETGDRNPDVFNRCLQPSEFRVTEQSTLDWWKANKGRAAILRHIQANLEPIRPTLLDFVEWVRRVSPNEAPVFWGNSPGFDWFFLHGYFTDYGVISPFHYTRHREVKTHVQACTLRDFKDVEKPHRQYSHNAVFDCVYQIELVCMHHQHRLKLDDLMLDRQLGVKPTDDDIPF